MNADGDVYPGWQEHVGPVSDGGDHIDLEIRLKGNEITDEDLAADLQTLAVFMISVDLAQLTYLEIATGGFQETFQASVNSIHINDVDPIYDRLQEISEVREEVRAAVQSLESRAQSTAQYQNNGRRNKISPRLHQGIWESFEKFFTFKSEEDEVARMEILAVSMEMTLREREQAFYWLNTNRINGARNYNEFLQMLQDGNLENITKIRSDLSIGGPYQGVYQTVYPDSNRPGGENIHRAGAEIVKRGAELNFEIAKETLEAAFTGIKKGFEYADKANQWVEFVKSMYINPLGTLQDITTDKNKSGIQERIQLDLMHAMPNIDEETAEQLAGGLTDEIMGSQPVLATAIAQMQSTHDSAADGVRSTGTMEGTPEENLIVEEESSLSAEACLSSSLTVEMGAPEYREYDFGTACWADMTIRNTGDEPQVVYIYVVRSSSGDHYEDWEFIGVQTDN